MSEPLVCPSCARSYPLDERFCAHCGTPLVYSPDAVEAAPVSEQRERARKIQPRYAEGELVRVAGSRNLTEAEFIQGLLLEEGVPSMLRRTQGFDVPDFLAAGPRDVLVPSGGLDAAREVLLQSDMLPASVPGPPAGKILLWLLVACAVMAVVAWGVSFALD